MESRIVYTIEIRKGSVSLRDTFSYTVMVKEDRKPDRVLGEMAGFLTQDGALHAAIFELEKGGLR